MAVVTLPELCWSAQATRWPGGPARGFRADARPRRRRTISSEVGLAVVAIVLLPALVLFAPRPHESSAHAPALTPPPHWVELAAPSPLLALDSPEFGSEPSLTAARREENGDGRRDIADFGRFEAGTIPYFHLSLARPGSLAAPAASFFVTVARRAAEAGLAVLHSDQPAPLATRLGDFEVADVVVARGTVQATCLGFHSRAAAPGFDLAGLACGGVGKPLTRTQLACTLDRLRPAAAGADVDLDGYFATVRRASAGECGSAEARPASQAVKLRAERNPKSTDHAKKARR